ncbi:MULTISPECIES: class I SAM-dependent methyltransferase [Pseudonocardia]|uniref:Trans-aconitate 2-methyltransferase n=2 Tax=Pseudonocardia TaxID=1847 RepID=A0A1Y2MLV6_PSEAH|nr:MULTISPECIES: class I SAM-dependent methyltransferase [Pseudonocardia]OSY36266.1 Trans-aconitate 2-methyltransferase [Pseudonocardia autotrophica]TDN73074.1 methyltransferase family protein [Pseudonocardia autotrophica]BBG03791.1 SAM-dependent methyltransferase [Pseudonocardia autotrophica]GEC26601.1 SAM-dependent methyltransferase [Pseudonocardia saturnea]
MTGSARSDHDSPHGTPHDDPHGHDVGEILDLDADLLGEQIAAIVASLPVRTAPVRIVDLGAGTGAGTFALLERFPDARVVAVDASAEHLRRLQHKAEQAGVSDRVKTVRADLNGAWPDLAPADLVWASASLHHLSDPSAALERVRALLTPDGLLAVLELAGPPRFLPADVPVERPGLEDRCHDAADRRVNAHVPHRGADWGPVIAAAGYTIESDRTLTVDNPRPPAGVVGRYALLVLGGMRRALADDLPAADLAALDRLLDDGDPAAVTRRDDLVVRTTRSVLLARP